MQKYMKSPRETVEFTKHSPERSDNDLSNYSGNSYLEVTSVGGKMRIAIKNRDEEEKRIKTESRKMLRRSSTKRSAEKTGKDVDDDLRIPEPGNVRQVSEAGVNRQTRLQKTRIFSKEYQSGDDEKMVEKMIGVDKTSEKNSLSEDTSSWAKQTSKSRSSAQNKDKGTTSSESSSEGEEEALMDEGWTRNLIEEYRDEWREQDDNRYMLREEVEDAVETLEKANNELIQDIDDLRETQIDDTALTRENFADLRDQFDEQKKLIKDLKSNLNGTTSDLKKAMRELEDRSNHRIDT